MLKRLQGDICSWRVRITIVTDIDRLFPNATNQIGRSAKRESHFLSSKKKYVKNPADIARYIDPDIATPPTTVEFLVNFIVLHNVNGLTYT